MINTDELETALAQDQKADSAENVSSGDEPLSDRDIAASQEWVGTASYDDDDDGSEASFGTDSDDTGSDKNISPDDEPESEEDIAASQEWVGTASEDDDGSEASFKSDSDDAGGSEASFGTDPDDIAASQEWVGTASEDDDGSEDSFGTDADGAASDVASDPTVNSDSQPQQDHPAAGDNDNGAIDAQLRRWQEEEAQSDTPLVSDDEVEVDTAADRKAFAPFADSSDSLIKTNADLLEQLGLSSGEPASPASVDDTNESTTDTTNEADLAPSGDIGTSGSTPEPEEDNRSVSSFATDLSSEAPQDESGDVTSTDADEPSISSSAQWLANKLNLRRRVHEGRKKMRGNTVNRMLSWFR